jgi:hypothetical protein
VQSAASWTKAGCIPELQDCSNPNAHSQSLNGSSTVRTRNNKYGAIHSFTYDVSRSTMIQQKISGFYNAQCCGLAFEFSNWHYGNSGVTLLPANHRFFMSFTLAGLGNFSPFNGALGGVTR